MSVTVTNVGGASGTITVPNGGYTLGSGIGLSGQTLTTNGYGSNWANITDSATQSSLQVKGNANFEGDVTIRGESLTDALARIEARLSIVKPIKLDPELEKKYEELEALGKQYRALQADIQEKEKVWAILNK